MPEKNLLVNKKQLKFWVSHKFHYTEVYKVMGINCSSLMSPKGQGTVQDPHSMLAAWVQIDKPSLVCVCI